MRVKGTILVTLLFAAARCQQELFRNPNFEEPFNGQDNWYCAGSCSLTKSNDAHTGSQSGEVTERSENWHGVTQSVPVQSGRAYHFSLQLKVLNQDFDALWHAVELMFAIDTTGGGGQTYRQCARSPYMQESEGWTTVGGDCKMPGDVSSARFYVQFPDPDIEYRVDAASLREIVANNNWRQEADARIETLRKRDIEIRFSAGPSFNPEDITIEVVQTRSGFPFGSAVVATMMYATDARSLLYQSVFYDNFEMATLENAHKWKQMEPEWGIINYDRPDRAVAALLLEGVPVRGHCVAWGVDERVPDWQFPMSGSEVHQEVRTRISGVVGRYRDLLVHWDVNNEQIHGDFYEDKTGDPYYTHDMFRQIRLVDPNVRLFYNDYNVVSGGDVTYAYTWSVKKAVEMGVPVDAMGVQGHFQSWFDGNRNVDLQIVWERLEVAAQAGLPIWVTELDVENPDRQTRAVGYENLLRLFFSHPSVEGVILWGFWDQQHWRPDAALFEGDDITPNAAGLRYMELVKQTWRTNATLRPNSNSQTFQVRGFHGDYEVRVSYLGQQISTQQFTLSRGTGSHVVNIQI